MTDDDGLERAAEGAAEGEGDADVVLSGVRVGSRGGSRFEILVRQSQVPQDCVVAVLREDERRLHVEYDASKEHEAEAALEQSNPDSEDDQRE